MKYSLLLLYTMLILLILDSCAKQNFFQEPPDYPVIDSIAPAAGFVGTQIRLWGSGFSTFTSQDTVRINGVRLRVDSPATSTVLLATLIDSTGTGTVQLTVKGQTAKGPIFTFLGSVVTSNAPVITSADFGWRDGTGYSVSVKTLPVTDNGIRVLVGGVNVPIAFVVRPGDPKYDPNKGNQILLASDSIVQSRADGIYANFMVTFNGVPSNTFPFQIKPFIADIFSRHGDYRFAAGDTLTIKGNFFGDRTQLPSSIFIVYNGVPLSQPTILSWSNTEIRAAMPAYPSVPANTGIPMDVLVGTKSYLLGSPVLYLGTAVTGGTVYVGGFENKVAKYWRDGTAVTLSNPAYNAVVNSIVVAGTDVYAGGYEINNDASPVKVAKYWKNGTGVTLTDPASTTSVPEINSMAVSGSDVYAAGYENINNKEVARYWKNGAGVSLTGSSANSRNARINAVVVIGNDVYAAGYEYVLRVDQGVTYAVLVAKYWKNGVDIKLNDTDGFGTSYASSMYVAGSDVYIAGYANGGGLLKKTAKYWKNGVSVNLSSQSSFEAEATSITVAGSDVYVAGYETPTATKVAKYWKNGIPVNLTDGTRDAIANAITLSGNDVYVAGFELNANFQNVAKYWKNGVGVNLTDGSKLGIATSIVVRP